MELANLDLGQLIRAAADKDLAEAIQAPPRNAWKDQQGFNLVSLGDWLDLCRRTDIPHVAGTHVASIDIDTLFAYDIDPDNPDLQAFSRAVNAAKKPATILRWDVCAPLAVKSALARGRADWDPGMLDGLSIDDPRASDLIYEYPGTSMAVYSHPWMETARLHNYPVEYRAYVRDGDVIGISNYYPQRPLDLDAELVADLGHVARHTRRLASALPVPVRFPGGPHAHWPSSSRSFTADFIKLHDGAVLYLEGGPPYGAGAHPCCFPADSRTWRQAAAFHLDGVPIALASAAADPDDFPGLVG